MQKGMTPVIVDGVPDDRYLIDRDGNVWSNRTNRYLQGSLITYRQYRIYKIGGRSVGLHRLLYETFIGPIPAGYDVDHVDNDSQNNRLDNLRAVSRSENLYNQKCKGYHKTTSGKYRPYIRTKEGIRYFPLCHTEQEARAVYLAAKEEYHKIQGYDYLPVGDSYVWVSRPIVNENQSS